MRFVFGLPSDGKQEGAAVGSNRRRIYDLTLSGAEIWYLRIFSHNTLRLIPR